MTLRRLLRFLVPALLLHGCSDLTPSFAQAPSQQLVSGNLSGVGSSDGDLIQARFNLVNCGGRTPTVPGAAMVKSSTIFTADVNGAITGAIWGNDAIVCSGISPTLYQVTYLRNNIPAAQPLYYRITAAFDPATATPVFVAPPSAPLAGGMKCPVAQVLLGVLADFTPVCSFAQAGVTIYGLGAPPSNSCTATASANYVQTDAAAGAGAQWLCFGGSWHQQGAQGVPGTGQPGPVGPASTQTINAFGDSYTCDTIDTTILGCLGMNIGGTGASKSYFSYLGRLAQSRGLNLTSNVNNYAGAGAEACDVDRYQVFPNWTGLTAYQVNILMAGVNDANTQGVGIYEQTFNLCHTAMLIHLATPTANKVSASTCSATGSSSVDGTYGANFLGWSGATGSTLTCSLTSNGGPLYLLYRITDGSAGSFTYTVDGGSQTTVLTAPPSPIDTGLLHTHTAVAAIRTGSISAGPHTIRFTAGADSSVYEVATAPTASLAGPADLLVGGVTYFGNDYKGAATKQYNIDAKANVDALAGDGLKIRFVDIRHFFPPTPSYYYTDLLHPNDEGHRLVASAYASAMGSNASGFPNVTDDTGGYPEPINMVQTSPTGHGVWYKMDNTAQGGILLQRGLAGTTDTSLAPKGCEYTWDVTDSSVLDYSCSQGTNIATSYRLENLHRIQRSGISSNFYRGADNAVLSGTGVTASCQGGHVCNNFTGMIRVDVPGAAPATGTQILTVGLPSNTGPVPTTFLNCTISPSVAPTATSLPGLTFGVNGLELDIFAISTLPINSTFWVNYVCGY